MAERQQIPHDGSYKAFYSNKEMVVSLFEDFVPKEYVKDMDFSTLELMTPDHVSENFIQRHDDIIWRVRWKDSCCYLFLLLEFQRKIDPFMAVRIAVYSSLLWQDLISRGKIKKGELLPLVFPLVLYNDKEVWNAPQSISELLPEMPECFKAIQPLQKYILVDELDLPDDLVQTSKSPSAYLFRLERIKKKDQIIQEIKGFSRVYQKMPINLKSIFRNWIQKVFLQKFDNIVSATFIDEALEGNTMFEDVVGEWADSIHEDGKKEAADKIFSDFHTNIIGTLHSRFGDIKSEICKKIKSLKDANVLCTLIVSSATVNSLTEFLEVLESKLSQQKI